MYRVANLRSGLTALIAIAALSGTARATPLAPVVSPFAYNVGVNYETFNTTNISADLAAVAENFRLIRTYHDAAVGTINPNIPEIDPGEAQVITYVVSHNTGQNDIQLVMGTNNNALAQGGFGTAWSAGLMTSSAYTDMWATMVIGAFGSIGAAKLHLKAILLGNELDANGPPPTDPNFTTYYQTWIPASFNNLKASLAAAGLGDIPISTTIANYPLSGSMNVVAVSVTGYITSNWSSGWNQDKPFVMFNQYTQNGGMSTDFDPVAAYFQHVADLLNSSPQVFVGETGYNAAFGEANEATVLAAIFEWLKRQRQDLGSTIPLFVFQAFDDPAQGQFGLYQRSPYQLKAGISVPSWVKELRALRANRRRFAIF